MAKSKDKPIIKKAERILAGSAKAEQINEMLVIEKEDLEIIVRCMASTVGEKKVLFKGRRVDLHPRFVELLISLGSRLDKSSAMQKSGHLKSAN